MGADHNRKRQNFCDDPVFFEGCKKLRQNGTGLDGTLEVPATSS
ncbi:hypothetical protein [Tistlia consotensis]|nr:hypothetical protein [Tistlia consotensis]